MSGQILLKCEPDSVRFTERNLKVEKDSEAIQVGRSGKENLQEENNAVFACRVLSKEHSLFSYNSGSFMIQDLGSSNGTFINGFRISKAGVTSQWTRVYTGDIIRFGSQVLDKERRCKERCVVARLHLLHPPGEDGNAIEEQSRPTSDKLYKKSNNGNGERKQVTFETSLIQSEEETRANSINKEAIENLEKRLKRKANETINLNENLEILRLSEESLKQEVEQVRAELDTKEEITKGKEAEWRRVEEELTSRLQEKQEENVRLLDELAVKTKQEMENFKVADLEEELDRTKRLLKKCQDDAWLLAEKLRLEMEKSKQREETVEQLTIQLRENTESREVAATAAATAATAAGEEIEEKIAEYSRIVQEQQQEIENLNDLLTDGDEIVKEKEKENGWLREMLNQDIHKLKEKESDYLNLQYLMTEESETVHQIESEMVRLLQMVELGQEAIGEKDQQIEVLREQVRKAQLQIKTKGEEVEKVRENHGSALEFSMREKNKVIERLGTELETALARVEVLENQIDDSSKQSVNSAEERNRTSLETNRLTGELRDCRSQVESLTSWLEEARQGEAEKARQIIVLDKELLELKSREKENNIKLSSLIEEQDSLRSQAKREASDDSDEMDSKTLRERIVREQESNRELEEELIALKLQLTDLKARSCGTSENTKEYNNIGDAEQKALLLLKDTKINQLEVMIQHEQQIVAQVQISQEKELLEKEEEIKVLRQLLKLDKQQQQGSHWSGVKLPFFFSQSFKGGEAGGVTKVETGDSVGGGAGDSGGAPPPPRPPRARTLSKGSGRSVREDEPEPLNKTAESSGYGVFNDDDDDDDTVTFHDALSEEEDILIDDLDQDSLDEEDGKYRKTDIGDISIGLD